jgi:hypothetical protein
MFEHDKDSDTFPSGNRFPDQAVQLVVFIIGDFSGDRYGQYIALHFFNMLEHGGPWADARISYLSPQ